MENQFLDNYFKIPAFIMYFNSLTCLRNEMNTFLIDI